MIRGRTVDSPGFLVVIGARYKCKHDGGLIFIDVDISATRCSAVTDLMMRDILWPSQPWKAPKPSDTRADAATMPRQTHQGNTASLIPVPTKPESSPLSWAKNSMAAMNDSSLGHRLHACTP